MVGLPTNPLSGDALESVENALKGLLLILKRSKTRYKLKIKRKLSFLMSGQTTGSATTSSMGIASMTYQRPTIRSLTMLPIEIHSFGENTKQCSHGAVINNSRPMTLISHCNIMTKIYLQSAFGGGGLPSSSNLAILVVFRPI